MINKIFPLEFKDNINLAQELLRTKDNYINKVRVSFYSLPHQSVISASTWNDGTITDIAPRTVKETFWQITRLNHYVKISITFPKQRMPFRLPLRENGTLDTLLPLDKDTAEFMEQKETYNPAQTTGHCLSFIANDI